MLKYSLTFQFKSVRSQLLVRPTTKQNVSSSWHDLNFSEDPMISRNANSNHYYLNCMEAQTALQNNKSGHADLNYTKGRMIYGNVNSGQYDLKCMEAQTTLQNNNSGCGAVNYTKGQMIHQMINSSWYDLNCTKAQTTVQNVNSCHADLNCTEGAMIHWIVSSWWQEVNFTWCTMILQMNSDFLEINVETFSHGQSLLQIKELIVLWELNSINILDNTQQRKMKSTLSTFICLVVTS